MDDLSVSVVIAARDAAATVARAVASARSQSPAPAEVIVVDDGSADETTEVARSAGARVIRRAASGGAAAARNAGVDVALGEWIATLDADDVWLDGHLATLAAHRAGQVLLSTSALACGADSAADRIFGVPRLTRLRDPTDLLVPVNPVVLSAAMFRRDVARAVGGFPEQIARSEDLDLWIRLLERGRGVALPQVTVLYAIHATQASHDRAAMRDATRRIADAYADRTWWSPGTRGAMAGAAAWDELRAAVRRRDHRSLARAGWGLLRGPGPPAGAGRLLRHRAGLRRRLAAAPAPADLAAARLARATPSWTNGP